MKPTRFSVVYDSFLSKITDDMYLELTERETRNLLRELLISAIPKFEFPRQSLEYNFVSFDDDEYNRYCDCECKPIKWNDLMGNKDNNQSNQNDNNSKYSGEHEGWSFIKPLNLEQINILSTYMIVEWLGQQLASVENVRMKYSGPDFKFTSQANHMQKILQMKKDYEREGFHLQRLYKRRIKDINGIYHSTMTKIMQPLNDFPVDSYSLSPDRSGDNNVNSSCCDEQSLEWERIII